MDAEDSCDAGENLLEDVVFQPDVDVRQVVDHALEKSKDGLLTDFLDNVPHCVLRVVVDFPGRKEEVDGTSYEILPVELLEEVIERVGDHFDDAIPVGVVDDVLEGCQE